LFDATLSFDGKGGLRNFVRSDSRFVFLSAFVLQPGQHAVVLRYEDPSRCPPRLN